jgi:hypothetical protein
MSFHYRNLVLVYAPIALGLILFYLGFIQKTRGKASSRGPRRRMWRIISPVSLFVGIFFLIHGGPPSHFPWKRYDFKEGGFSALFPGPPESTIDKKKEGEFEFTEYKLHFETQQPAYDFRVIVTPIPSEVEFSLEKVEENLSKGAAMKLLDRKLISIEGRPAVEVLLKGDDGVDVKTRLYVLDGKYYQIIVVASEEALKTKEMDEFFDSVKPLSAS